MNDRRVLNTNTFRLSYADTDPAGILYYAAWFPRMEAVQSEFLFLEGLRQDSLIDRFGWWTVSRTTKCEFLKAAVLFDEIRIELRMGHIGRSSFTFEHEMWRLADGQKVAQASNTLVTVSPEQKSVLIPLDLRERLESWSD